MRRGRFTVSGVPHHITQRGNRRSNIFLDAEDRHVYLELLREYSARHQVRLWTYNLMTNHTHLIVVPESESSISDTLRDTHSAYASMFNRKHGYSGHLWQGRFYSCVLDAKHLAHAVRYVECNPVRAGMVVRAEDYPWSSAGPHVLGTEDRYLASGLPLIGLIKDWAAWLAGDPDEESIRAIREATATGRACGSEEFIRQMEHHYGRPLRPQKRGRKPRKVIVEEPTSIILPAGW
jgi:putative transposase